LEKILRRDLDNRANTPRKPASRLAFVPLQGHWDRVNTPLRETTGRERLLVRIVLAVVGIAVLAAIVVAIATGGGSNGGGTAEGCVRVDIPSTMGGSTIHACGRRAAEFCSGPIAHHPSLSGVALPRCREAGYATVPQ
jgi:hypothetical protein